MGTRLPAVDFEVDKWNEESIKYRANQLFKEAVHIWEYPKTSFTPQDNGQKTYTLDDEKDFTFEKVISYNFLDQRHNVSNWTEFYMNLLTQCMDLDEYCFDKILSGDVKNDSLEKCFSRNKSDLRNGAEIKNSLFAETNLNTENKLQVLRKILELLNIDLIEVAFVIK